MKRFDHEIKVLGQSDCFVFGSNTQGRHGKGAAKQAMKFGAVYGQAEGPQGFAYAIVTKDLTKPKEKQARSVSLCYIRKQIVEFLDYAEDNPGIRFYVSQFGSSLAGFKPEEIAMLFAYYTIPDNVYMNKTYADIIDNHWSNHFREC